MRASRFDRGNLTHDRVAHGPWRAQEAKRRLDPSLKGTSRSAIRGSGRAQVLTHEELFTSGAYVSDFQPESASNPFAADYARKRKAVIDAVSGTDQRVLDLGGGMGRMSIPLSSRHFVTLTDISPQMLELARPHASERLRLQVADARSLPFEDQSFDYVLAIDLLPHIPSPQDLLLEARRVLKPGGRLIIDNTNSVPLWTLAYPRYLGRRPYRWVRIWRSGGVLPEWSSRVRHHRRRSFLGLLAEAGFNVASVRGFGPRGCPKWHLAVAVKR
ncbi:MAG: class I SAM-dependent methyltransferase [Chloroflexi bacterium]|nr:MAG: class I SAM-dependent methyltransferase [Chloroflexota bacterium]